MAALKMSHPMWVRGLKPNSSLARLLPSVAPYVGAWIETPVGKHRVTTWSRTLCGCVD